MQRTGLSLVLTLLLLGSLWPVVGIAAEPSDLKTLLRHLQQEIGRLPQPEVQARLGRLQQEFQQVLKSLDVPITASAVTVQPPEFSTVTDFSSLQEPQSSRLVSRSCSRDSRGGLSPSTLRTSSASRGKTWCDPH